MMSVYGTMTQYRLADRVTVSTNTCTTWQDRVRLSALSPYFSLKEIFCHALENQLSITGEHPRERGFCSGL
jgi:hypothetical protein